MATELRHRPERIRARVEQKVQKLRELYADAPELGRVALENGLPLSSKSWSGDGGGKAPVGSAPPGQGLGAHRDLSVRERGSEAASRPAAALEGNFQGADAVGTVHDMRFVFLDNDTKLLFATAYDGEWDAYIDDFATKIPNAMDLLFCNAVGWPGIRSPKVKDWIVEHQISAEAWYVANPNLTVAETRRLERVGKAVEELLDKIA
jgi:hypothetical protein